MGERREAEREREREKDKKGARQRQRKRVREMVTTCLRLSVVRLSINFAFLRKNWHETDRRFTLKGTC